MQCSPSEWRRCLVTTGWLGLPIIFSSGWSFVQRWVEGWCWYTLCRFWGFKWLVEDSATSGAAVSLANGLKNAFGSKSAGGGTSLRISSAGSSLLEAVCSTVVVESIGVGASSTVVVVAGVSGIRVVSGWAAETADTPWALSSISSLNRGANSLSICWRVSWGLSSADDGVWGKFKRLWPGSKLLYSEAISVSSSKWAWIVSITSFVRRFQIR